MTTASRILVFLTAAGLLLGCGTESDRSIAGSPVADHTANFSPWSEPVTLGPAINSPYNDQQPALSKEGLTLYFASNRPEGPDDAVLDNNIWVSERACTDADDPACAWQPPVELGAPVNTEFNDAGPALSRDRHWLFLQSNRPGGLGSNDIWVSRRDDVNDDFAWRQPVNLGPGVNTAGFEGGASYFENEEGGAPQLFFNGNPAPSASGGDIYVSVQAADGSFGTAVPIPELNSPSSDQRPSIAHSGVDVYFFSDRPGSSANDIWVSTRESVFAPWEPPTNLGAPINTAVAEQHPFIASDGGTELLYFARNVAIPPAIDLDLFVSTRTRGGNAP